MLDNSSMVQTGRYYDETGLTGDERDALVVRLRGLGWSYRRIGAATGLTANGVMHALRRIEDGRPGRAPRG